MHQICTLVEVLGHCLRVVVRTVILHGDQLFGSGHSPLCMDHLVVVVEELGKMTLSAHVTARLDCWL